jgi:hypothetical protein
MYACRTPACSLSLLLRLFLQSMIVSLDEYWPLAGSSFCVLEVLSPAGQTCTMTRVNTDAMSS